MPVALSIAGSDPGGGAGVQADLRTFMDHGVHGTCAITAITAQGRRHTRRVQPIEPGLLLDQLRAVHEDFEIRAVKIGMLGDEANLLAVARFLSELPPAVPSVLDPVLASSNGLILLDPSATLPLLEALLPRTCLLTPNLPELERLEKLDPDLQRRCQDAGVALLVKGGHGHGPEICDRLLLSDGRRLELRHPRLDNRPRRGTGCTLSSAIAARLARGEELEGAVVGAVRYLQRLLRCPAGPECEGGEPLPHGCARPG